MGVNTVRTASEGSANSVELTFNPEDEAVVGPITAFSNKVFQALGSYPGQFLIKQESGRISIEGLNGQVITPFSPFIGELKQATKMGVGVVMYRTEPSNDEALFTNG